MNHSLPDLNIVARHSKTQHESVRRGFFCFSVLLKFDSWFNNCYLKFKFQCKHWKTWKFWGALGTKAKWMFTSQLLRKVIHPNYSFVRMEWWKSYCWTPSTMEQYSILKYFISHFLSYLFQSTRFIMTKIRKSREERIKHSIKRYTKFSCHIDGHHILQMCLHVMLST